MNGKEILELGRMAKARSDERMMKNHPEIVKAVQDKCAAKIADLEKSNAEQAERIAALEAELDGWRRRASEENAAADVAATGNGAKRTRKGK